MEKLLKILLPFFSTPKNYEQILTKLASLAFYETYVITFILRENTIFHAFLSNIESWGPIGRVVVLVPHHETLNLSGLAIAVVVAVLTHTFQFHDRVSDLFGIRRRFDRKSILVPLSQRVGSPVDKDKGAKIRLRRDELMRAVFYKYASSRAETPLVDKHDIEHALNAWSWFWSFVEAVAYFGVGAIIAWWLGSNDLAGFLAILSGVFYTLALLQRARLSRYARPQIDSIAADPTAAANVKQQFDAL